MNYIDVSFLCKALSDANRLKIVEMLSKEEKCACKLLEAFEITQPTLSHHMKILEEAKLVKIRKEGKWCHYSLDTATFNSFMEYMKNLLNEEQGDN